MNNGLRLRVGRFAQPLFMYFENLRAEQAYPWAHLPTEGNFSVSSAITFTGADALYRLLLGDWNLNVQAYTDDARRQPHARHRCVQPVAGGCQSPFLRPDRPAARWRRCRAAGRERLLKDESLQQVQKKSPQQVEKNWARMIFTSKTNPLRELKVADVKAVMASTPGATGPFQEMQHEQNSSSGGRSSRGFRLA